MYKLIVERPRRGKDGNAAAARLRNDFNGPARLRARAGYGYRSLNENLSPLRRYLRAQVGHPWEKVFSEICANIDRRNTVQQHIHQHIRDFIAIDVGIRKGQWVDLTNRGRFLPSGTGIYQELYVDPSSGLVRLSKDYHSWRQSAAKRRQREQAEITARHRNLGWAHSSTAVGQCLVSRRSRRIAGQPAHRESHRRRDAAVGGRGTTLRRCIAAEYLPGDER